MLPEDNLQQYWQRFELKMTETLGHKPGLEDILLFIGIREAGLPSKKFTETEKINLMQMAACTVLVPGRYYQLFWVEDSGWPHYTQLEREPQMSAIEREEFLKPYILLYAEKNKLV